MIIARSVLLRSNNVSEKSCKVAEKIKAHILCSMTPPLPPESHVVWR